MQWSFGARKIWSWISKFKAKLCKVDSFFDNHSHVYLLAVKLFCQCVCFLLSFLSYEYKGHLISTQNCWAVTSPKKGTKCTQNTTLNAFCWYFGRSYGSTILFRDLLTFRMYYIFSFFFIYKTWMVFQKILATLGDLCEIHSLQSNIAFIENVIWALMRVCSSYTLL